MASTNIKLLGFFFSYLFIFVFILALQITTGILKNVNMSTDARSAWLAPYPSLVHQGVYINGDKRAAHATHKPVTVTYVSLVAIIRFSV